MYCTALQFAARQSHGTIINGLTIATENATKCKNKSLFQRNLRWPPLPTYACVFSVMPKRPSGCDYVEVYELVCVYFKFLHTLFLAESHSHKECENGLELLTTAAKMQLNARTRRLCKKYVTVMPIRAHSPS